MYTFGIYELRGILACNNVACDPRRALDRHRRPVSIHHHLVWSRVASPWPSICPNDRCPLPRRHQDPRLLGHKPFHRRVTFGCSASTDDDHGEAQDFPHSPYENNRRGGCSSEALPPLLVHGQRCRLMAKSTPSDRQYIQHCIFDLMPPPKTSLRAYHPAFTPLQRLCRSFA